MPPERRYPLILLAAFAVVWAVLAIDASPRFGWFMEQIIVAVALPVLWFTRRAVPLSNTSYTLIFLFLVIHEVGAHWSYWVPLPWDEWGFARNHYDRVVHFAFGLLLVVPLQEAVLHLAAPRRGWVSYVAVEAVLAFSALYEIVEWLASLVVAPEAADRFVGLQGDIFDPVKDMALAGAGAILGLPLAFLAGDQTRRA